MGHKLTLCMLFFFKIMLSSAGFFNFFKKNFVQEHYQVVQNDLIQIKTDVLSVLILFQTVCKCLKQTTQVAASDE